MNSSSADLTGKFEQAVAAKGRKPVRKLFSATSLRILRHRQAARLAKANFVKAQLFTGQTMNVVLPEVVSGSIYCYGFFDEVVTTLVLNCLKAEDTFLDIGAHFGFFSMLASHIVGPAGRVISFEPTPSTFEKISENIASLANAEVLQLALGSAPGTALINDFGLEYCAWNYMGDTHRIPDGLEGHARQFEVTVDTVDAIVQIKALTPDVIKIDTENFEEEVFRGMQDTLAKYRPKIILEAKSEYSLRVGQALINQGYKVFRAKNDRTITPAQQDWALTNEAEYNVLFVPE